MCKRQTLKGSRLQENTILMQHDLPLRFGGLFLRKFIKDKQEVWKRWWASGGLRGRRQASRLFIGSGDMITSKSSQHFLGVCGPCAIKSHNKLEGELRYFFFKTHPESGHKEVYHHHNTQVPGGTLCPTTSAAVIKWKVAST